MAQEGTRCELLVSSMNRKRVLRSKTAQQSVQRIFGSLRDLQAFFWLQVFSTSQTESQPTQNPLTPAVGWLIPNREL